MHLNESRCRTAERCLRAYWFYFCAGPGGHGYRHRMVDKKLAWGSIIHAGLAAHYRGQPVRPALDTSLAEEFPTFQAESYAFKNEWLDELDRIERILGRYAQWAAPQDNFVPFGVEQSGSAILGESCWRCGTPYIVKDTAEPCQACMAERHHFVFRLDLLVRNDYGLEVWDHKSTESSIDDKYLARWDHSYQMFGYCYGAGKRSGLPVPRYTVNIIRKVLAAEAAPDMTKCCPDCKAGKRKILTCETCSQTGRVPRAERPADTPFVRKTFDFSPTKRDQFVSARVRLANKLTEHTLRLREGDLTAFPHNPSSWSCPEICYIPAGADIRSAFVSDEKYLTKGPDYVTLKAMAREEVA